MSAEPKNKGGRPPKAPEDRAGERVTIRLTAEQAAELRRRGGPPSIRAWLDATPADAALGPSGAPIAPADSC